MKISLNQQIDEIERELAQRAEVYPRQVARGAMRPSVADFQIARLRAVKATLLWLRENEAEIRDHVAARAAARKHGAAA